MKRIRTLLFMIIIFSLVGCNLPLTQFSEGAAGPSAPTAWLDAPLDGSTIPLAPYEVIFHIADVAGVALGEVSVNGQVISSLPNPNGTDTPATLRSMWTPPSPGLYTIQVRAQGVSGNWSGYASARVTVGGPTETPTPVITITPTPTPPPAEIIFTPAKSTGQFYFGACEPNRVDMSVQLSNTNSVKHVEIYINLLDMNSSDSSGWNSYAVMSDNGNGLFRTTVKSSEIQGADQFASMTVLYQFIVIGPDGKAMARSTSYNDLTLTACVSNFQPIIPIIPIIPIFPRDGPTLIPPGGPTLIPPPK